MSIDWNKPIQTRLGKPARLLGGVKGCRPHAVAILYTDHEVLEQVYPNGRIYSDDRLSAYDIVNVLESKNYWLVCHACGWEHAVAACYNQCPDCGAYGSIHIHSNRDGEQPKKLISIQETDK